MNKRMIKPKNKPVWRDGGMGIRLEKDEVYIGDIEKKALEEGYREQASRHVTIIGDKTFELIDSAFKESSNEELLRERIIDLFDHFDWKFEPKEIYHIEKTATFDGGGDLIEARQSYIRAVDMQDMAKFYREMNKLLGADLPVQFPHITLFTIGERENPKWRGIGIDSEEKFKTLNPRFIK